MWNLLIILAIGFTIFAVYSFYSRTDPTKSVPTRVWASIVAALAAAGAWLTAFFQGGGVIPS